MHRSGLFWKVVLPTIALIVGSVVVIAAESLSQEGRVALLTLLVAAAALHALWIAWRVASVVNSLATSIHRLEADPTDDHWSKALPIEVVSVVESVDGLNRRLLDRVAELDRINAEHTESTALFEVVLRTMNEGVVVLDGEQRILFVNDAARPLLGVQAAEIVGRPIWEVSRLSAVNQAVGVVTETGEAVHDEFDIPRSRLQVEMTAAPLPGDPFPGTMLVLHDVTELRRLETLRRDFVSNVSHELKTPLTSIQAYADTLLDNEASGIGTDERRYFLEKIVIQAERLGAIILDIIRLGKIESQSDVFDVCSVRVGPVVSACVDAHAAIAEAKKIQLSVDLAGAPPAVDDLSVLADARELRTILDNLVDNALHYTPSGGSVTVVLIPPQPAQELLGIAVVDTGIGIAEDQQARVFERFYRVDRARDRQQGGTGLGLSIVKHLCQLFGGRVDVQSELGVGTTFTAWLPVGVPERSSEDADHSVAAGDLV